MNAAENTTNWTGEVSEDDDKIITVTENIPPVVHVYPTEARNPVAISLVSLKLVKTIDPVGAVRGVAFLKGFIYILTQGCISVYSTLEHDHVKTIALPPYFVIMNETGDMAASEKSGNLYLCGVNSVWKFTADCDKAVPWLSIRRHVTSMSAAQDENVLIGTSETARNRQPGQIGCAMLHVYRPNAKVAKQFMFPDKRGSLLQAIAISSGSIVMVFSESQEVVEMNLQGVIVRAYKQNSCGNGACRIDEFGSSPWQYPNMNRSTETLRRSSACIAESGKGCIFIGFESLDCNCSWKLVVINSDFQLQQELLPNLHYDCWNFRHIFFNKSHSLLLTSCGRYEEKEEEAVAKKVKLFEIRGA